MRRVSRVGGRAPRRAIAPGSVHPHGDVTLQVWCRAPRTAGPAFRCPLGTGLAWLVVKHRDGSPNRWAVGVVSSRGEVMHWEYR